MINRLILAGLTAFASASLMGTSAGTAPMTGSAPCAPVYGKRPAPPGSLRIIGEMLRLPRVWIDPPSIEDEHVSGPHVADVPVTMVDPSAYFDALSVRPDCMVAYSLRDMNQLLAFMDQPNPEVKPWDVTYDPLHDPDPRAQDAAKLLVPANEPSLPNNVRFPIPSAGTDPFLITWDVWMGREFSYASTGINNYKHFQLASADHFWTQITTEFDRAKESPGALGMFSVRQLGESSSESPIGPNVTNANPLSPYRTFAMMPETWTRYWVYFNPVADRWFEFSMWIADENHDAVKTIDRLLIKPNYAAGATSWEKLWLEYNTSDHGWDTGFPARVSYARNIVILRGISDPASLLQRPVR